jgi:hypothetical protein
MAYPQDMMSGGYGYSYSGPSGGFQPPQPVYGGGGGYGGGAMSGGYTSASSAYSGGYGGGGGGYSYGSTTPRTSRSIDPSLYFTPAKAGGMSNSAFSWAHDSTMALNNAQMNQFGMQQMQADMAAQTSERQHGYDMELLNAKMGAERGNSAADRAFGMQKLQAEMQLAREQNQMSAWATYMDQQNAEQNRLAQMEQQRRGFLDNEAGRAQSAYYSYGI